MKYPPFDIAIRLIHNVRHVKGQLIKRPLCIASLEVWLQQCCGVIVVGSREGFQGGASKPLGYVGGHGMAAGVWKKPCADRALKEESGITMFWYRMKPSGISVPGAYRV
ncbi:hypothetical protein DSO57_1030605 [Entomophthora muscae]|uniref:Uncharacterized protein n=1 Tax=Entomophthora muscae TaxID=34485 RepID=A0ACC2TYS8_9FUNG|nr:hypothetical protein DSO57_1030605 [Entomophthora muscae]